MPLKREARRPRFRKPKSLKKVDGKWIAQWWENGHRRKRTLGAVSSVPKAQARKELDAILAPINSQAEGPSPNKKWSDFVNGTYLPFYKRKWKRSTTLTNEDRLRVHLEPIFGERTLGSFTREASALTKTYPPLPSKS